MNLTISQARRHLNASSNLLRRQWSIYPAHSFKTRSHRYATHSSGANEPSFPRKQITIAQDGGRPQWNELTVPGKVARTAQQSFNLLTILTGMIMTGGVITLLYLEVFSSESKTSHFNRAVDRVKKDPRCIEVLGDRKMIKAYGEPTYSRWAKARPIASTVSKDQAGTEHLAMRFNVEGPKNKGVVSLQMTKRVDQKEFQYQYLALDVKNYPRIYLENADAVARGNASKKDGGMKLFGFRLS
ncbi:MAG: mitochondrial import inner membrane translocase subunit tim21 [Peltula sp. TS41687]|nr:MAG: mitochondrial import inner membrane translocase subunit tim21 [Peltula sp. TS41687]